MHPAKSVIFFTTATGAGYGLFFWLAVLHITGFLPNGTLFTPSALIIGFGLIVGGLLSSTLHLGRPERAWRALSQWRSSWLSREGVMAILTFIPMSLFAIYWMFLAENAGMMSFFAIVTALVSLITVFTTSMIYASLKAIPAWHNNWTKIGYLVLSLMTGAVLATAMLSLIQPAFIAFTMSIPALIFLVLGLITKLIYWRHIHRAPATSTAESATGLGRFGKVSLAASPHGEDNYLLKEMGFKIARKHASKLRLISIVLGFVVPILLIGTIGAIYTGAPQPLFYILAAISCAFGIVMERWLFFAEAKHVVTLYYGEHEI